MDEEETTELVSKVIGDYLDQLDEPGDVDADDLAENIVRNLKRVEK